MKKIFRIVLPILLIGTLLASCSSTSSEKKPDESQKIEQIDSAAKSLEKSAQELEAKTKKTEQEIDELLKDI